MTKRHDIEVDEDVDIVKRHDIEVDEDVDIVLKADGETFATITVREIVAQSANERPATTLTLAGWNLDGTDGETATITVYWPAD